MPCNYNNVCFNCRNSFKLRGGGVCPDCGNSLISLGDKRKIPRKIDIKGWKKLEKHFIAWCKANPCLMERYAKYLEGKKT